jgi:hypothetical protein
MFRQGIRIAGGQVMPQLIVYIDLPENHKIDEEPKFMETIRDTITSLEMNDQVTYWEWEIH